MIVTSPQKSGVKRAFEKLALSMRWIADIRCLESSSTKYWRKASRFQQHARCISEKTILKIASLHFRQFIPALYRTDPLMTSGVFGIG
jgi:hypothetical protein